MVEEISFYSRDACFLLLRTGTSVVFLCNDLDRSSF